MFNHYPCHIRDYFTSPSSTPQAKSKQSLACQQQRSDTWNIDSGFLPPLPTLTPPCTEPEYSMMAGVGGFYPSCSTSTTGLAAASSSQRGQNVNSSPVNHALPGSS